MDWEQTWHVDLTSVRMSGPVPALISLFCLFSVTMWRLCFAQPRIVSWTPSSWQCSPSTSHRSFHSHIVHPWIHSLRIDDVHQGSLQPNMEPKVGLQARFPIWRGWSLRHNAGRRGRWRGCRVLMNTWSVTCHVKEKNRAQPTNVGVTVHMAWTNLHEFGSHFFSSLPLLALKPIGLEFPMIREWCPGWVYLPLRCWYNFACSRVYELHPAICWILSHVLDELFFREGAHFWCVLSEESCVNVDLCESSKLNFKKLFSMLAWLS